MVLFLLNKKRWIFTEESGVAASLTETGGVMVAANESIEMTPPVIGETSLHGNEVSQMNDTVAKLEQQAVEALKSLMNF